MRSTQHNERKLLNKQAHIKKPSSKLIPSEGYFQEFLSLGAKTGVFSEKIHGTKKPNKVAESVRQERGNRKVKTKHLKFNEEDLKYSSLLKTPNARLSFVFPLVL